MLTRVWVAMETARPRWGWASPTMPSPTAALAATPARLRVPAALAAVLPAAQTSTLWN